MLMNKTIAQALIAVQLITTTVGVSGLRADDSPASTTPTAEESLLTSVYRIQGTTTNSADAQKQVIAATQDYLNNSQPEGRQERLTQALLKMNLYSESRITGMMSDISASSSSLSSKQFSSNQEEIKVVSSQLQDIFANHPANAAQFSSCDVAAAGYPIIVVGIVTFVMGLFMLPATNISQTVSIGLTATGGALAVIIGPILEILAGGDNC